MLKMVDLRSQILSARKPVKSVACSGHPAVAGKSRSIAPVSNSPFGIYDNKKKNADYSPSKQAHVWADGLLRAIAGRQERVVLAIRDAARQAENLSIDPIRNAIYVASSIRTRWNLKPDQLSKGIRTLEAQGFLRITHSKRGRHARFVLALKTQAILNDMNVPTPRKLINTQKNERQQ